MRPFFVMGDKIATTAVTCSMCEGKQHIACISLCDPNDVVICNNCCYELQLEDGDEDVDNDSSSDNDAVPICDDAIGEIDSF
mmetsp:Transcript_6437/g.12367  ORF Transcript_6437/g.12367 Transcript_6437/m.12367 type:complete len:82 (-) Transcript_6437:123-368(-)